MGRKRRGGVHKRRGRLSAFLGRLCLTSLIVVLLVLALTLFFRVDTVRVEGCRQYEPQQVMDISGIKKGDNMFFINKSDVSARLFRELPYVCNVVITRHFPSSVTLKIEESTAAATFSYQGSTYILNARTKVMEELTSIPVTLSAEVSGVATEAPEIGKTLVGLTEEDAERLAELSALLSVLEAQGLLEEVQSIALAQEDYLEMSYLNRFRVLIPWGADYDYKIRNLIAVVDCLEVNETGTIDMTRSDGEVHFLP